MSGTVHPDVIQDTGITLARLRPFYFVVVFWGERFRSYLVDFCLPSLLSPHNIPALPLEDEISLFSVPRQMIGMPWPERRYSAS